MIDLLTLKPGYYWARWIDWTGIGKRWIIVEAIGNTDNDKDGVFGLFEPGNEEEINIKYLDKLVVIEDYKEGDD